MLLDDDEDAARPRERAGAGVIKINKESMQEIKKRSAGQLPEHLQVCRVTHLNASCHIYMYIYILFEEVLSHIWKSHVIYLSASCHTFE